MDNNANSRVQMVIGRELASRFFEDRTRPRTTVRPSVRIRDLDRVLRHVHPTSTSRDVSDLAFPSLSNFYCVLRCACGGRPGNEASTHVHVFFLGKVTALGVLCWFDFFVCLTLLASFFFPSHLSFKNMYIPVCSMVHLDYGLSVAA